VANFQRLGFLIAISAGLRCTANGIVFQFSRFKACEKSLELIELPASIVYRIAALREHKICEIYDASVEAFSFTS
jgi:hypothetical protein